MTFDAQRLARPAIVAMAPYSSARSESKGVRGRVYLDANELAELAEPADLAKVDGQGGPGGQLLNRYPEPQPTELQQFFQDRLGVGASQLFLGAGVDDAIDALLRVFCEAREDAILVTPPTYGYYQVAAAIQGARVLAAPLQGPDFELDEELLVRTCTPQTKLVFVCSPNNPTGQSFAPQRLRALAARLAPGALLVVDEAYIEFSQRPSLVSEVAAIPNLVVLRTLSKAWGLAGVRLGAAIAAPSVIALMHKVRAPYPISRPAVAAGMAVLNKLTAADLLARVAAVVAEREALAVALAQLPQVRRVYPSDANFLLLKTTDARGFMRRCQDAGVIVRDRSGEPGLSDCVRISVGTAAEHAELLAALHRGGV